MGTFTTVNFLSGVIKYGLFGLTHPLVGPNWANAISVVVSTLFQYVGYRKITWRDRKVQNSFLKFLVLEVPVTIAEISIFPTWRLMPVWEKVLNLVGIDSILVNGYLALYVFGFAMWLSGILYHNFVTFKNKGKTNQERRSR